MIKKSLGFLLILLSLPFFLYILKELESIVTFVLENRSDFTSYHLGMLLGMLVVNAIIFLVAFFLLKFGLKFIKKPN